MDHYCFESRILSVNEDCPTVGPIGEVLSASAPNLQDILPRQGKAELHQLGLIMGLVGLPDEASGSFERSRGTFARESRPTKIGETIPLWEG